MNTTIDTGVPVSGVSFTGWRLMFRLAAVFNICVALPLWIYPVWVATTFGFEPVPVDILYTDLFSALVLVFGIGYWRIGADPVHNRAIIEMGIVGKLLVVFIGYQHFFMGSTSLSFASLVTADLVWALFFWRYLHITSASE